MSLAYHKSPNCPYKIRESNKYFSKAIPAKSCHAHRNPVGSLPYCNMYTNYNKKTKQQQKQTNKQGKRECFSELGAYHV